MTSTPRCHLALLFTALATGCGSASPDATASDTQGAGPELLSTLPAIDTPAGGQKFVTPIIKAIPPGTDVTYCTFTDSITEAEALVHTTGGVQSPHGHHAILFYAPVPEKPRTEECGSVAMERFRQLLGGTGGEGGLFWDPPANVATRVPKGAQYVIQTHWINTTSEPIDAQAAMVTYPGEKGPDTVTAGTLAVVATAFSIPAHGKLDKTTECTFDVDHDLLISLPHEHEWGTHVKADVLRAGGKTDAIFDTPFDPSFVSHPPFQAYGTKDPFKIAKGDKVRLTCSWSNTSNEVLGFPREMCVMFGFAMEDDDAVCTEGEWDHSVLGGGGGGSGAHCVPTDAAGNEQGVGRYCSKGGGQCLENGGGKATICAIDFDSDPNSSSTFCTKVCQTTADCGADAVCAGDSPTSATKGCVPLSCAPDWAKK
jgi:hypothetical protein